MTSLDKNDLIIELRMKKICRFCLCQNDSKLTNIYTKDTHIKLSAPLPNQIMDIASIKVFRKDNMPSYVCIECKNMFEFSYQFQQMCKKADKLLRQFPSTAKWPESLDKPVFVTSNFSHDTSVRQESSHLSKNILNSSISLTDNAITFDISSQSERNVDFTTFVDKIESNGEPSTDDIHHHQQPCSVKDLNRHKDEEDPNNTAVIECNVFPCTHCERTFSLLQLRDIHMKDHFRDRKFQCDICKTTFLSKHNLLRHSIMHSDQKPYICSVCDKDFSRSTALKRHEKRVHRDIPKHLCSRCDRSFLSKEDMEKHLENHKIVRPFVCKICSKGFAFKQGLDRHEVIHSRQQPYTCQYCEQGFPTITKLYRHLTTHAGVRPYPCKYCKKSYLLSHHLSRHLRSHKNVDDPANTVSFACMRCNCNFGTRHELISHSTTHANEINLACSLCKDVFDNISDLNSHIQDHAQGEAYACEFCDLIFLSAEKLQSHTDPDHINEMKAYHSDDNARANKLMEDNKSQINILDIAEEKLQENANELLAGKLPHTGDDVMKISLKKDIKVETESSSPKIIHEMFQSRGDNEIKSNRGDDEIKSNSPVLRRRSSKRTTTKKAPTKTSPSKKVSSKKIKLSSSLPAPKITKVEHEK